MVSFPERPTLIIVFKINYHYATAGKRLPDEFCLSTDILNIEMPIVTWLHFFAHSLFGGIAIGQRIQDEDSWFFAALIVCGPVDCYPHIFHPERVELRTYVYPGYAQQEKENEHLYQNENFCRSYETTKLVGQFPHTYFKTCSPI